MSGFADAHRQAIAAGLPDNVDTYGLISGLWTSVFALGAFIGPTVAGILFDAIHFPLATLFVIIAEALVIIFITIFVGVDMFRSVVYGILFLLGCAHFSMSENCGQIYIGRIL